MCCILQGKKLVAVAAAKRHTMVMSSDGDIYTWGHRVVTPRRVQLAGEICMAELEHMSVHKIYVSHHAI